MFRKGELSPIAHLHMFPKLELYELRELPHLTLNERVELHELHMFSTRELYTVDELAHELSRV